MGAVVKGLYRVKNARKYRGNPANVVYRSSWELREMMVLDDSPGVVEWSSEEIAIPYRSPLDGRVHRYFPDFYYKTIAGERYIVEVKPASQTRPPEARKRKTKRAILEHVAYAVNEAKWAAARAYCEERGMRFEIMTEDDLGIVQWGRRGRS